jgi:hypothetical protein
VQTNGHAIEKPTPPPDLFNARNVVQILEGLMVKVTAEECTAHTVNAACNAAARITDILRLHLEAERLKRRISDK